MRYLKSPWLIKESQVRTLIDVKNFVSSKIELKNILTHCGDILQDLEHDTINNETHGLKVYKTYRTISGKNYKNVELSIGIRVRELNRQESDSYFKWSDVSFYIEDLKSYLESKDFAMTYLEVTDDEYDDAYDTYKNDIPLIDINFKFRGVIN